MPSCDLSNVIIVQFQQSSEIEGKNDTITNVCVLNFQKSLEEEVSAIDEMAPAHMDTHTSPFGRHNLKLQEKENY